MIKINSFIHRQLLDDVIRRWMYDEASPADADLITRLVFFNHVYVSRYLRQFAERIFQGLHRCEVSFRAVRIKGGLKDALVSDPPYRTDRIDSLIGEYRRNPGRYYRETPFHGSLCFCRLGGAEECVGTLRIKRVRRLAEKSARRIIDRIFAEIKRHADTLADERALRLGIPRVRLVTAPADMTEEFIRAEDRMLDDLREKRPIAEDRGAKELAINDVAGVKVILEGHEQHKLKALLEGMPECGIVEEERHTGRYNATNLIVRYRPSREAILAPPLGRGLCALLEARGFSADETNRAFSEFVRFGEEDVLLEIILSTYQEMLESEIGRCIHEDRIIEQRLRQEYRGPLARNIQYLMEFLFTFPSAPSLWQCEFGALPIKLWNRYLPDYFDEVLKQLFRMPSFDDWD